MFVILSLFPSAQTKPNLMVDFPQELQRRAALWPAKSLQKYSVIAPVSSNLVYFCFSSEPEPGDGQFRLSEPARLF